MLRSNWIHAPLYEGHPEWVPAAPRVYSNLYETTELPMSPYIEDSFEYEPYRPFLTRIRRFIKDFKAIFLGRP